MKVKSNRKVILVIFALFISSLAILIPLFWGRDYSDLYMGCKVTWLDGYIDSINQNVFPSFSDNNDHAYGIFILGMYLGSFLGLNAAETFTVINILVSITTIWLFTYEIWVTTESYYSALIAPFLVLYCFRSIAFLTLNDVYVGLGAQFVLLSLPLIFQLIKGNLEEHRRIKVYIMLLILLALANMARGSTSLPLLIFFVCLCVEKIIKAIKVHDLKEVFSHSGLMAVAWVMYGSFVDFVPNLILRIHGQEIGLKLASSVWHSIYIGFGYLANPYGIEYLDESGFLHCQQLYPDVQYATNEYYDSPVKS